MNIRVTNKMKDKLLKCIEIFKIVYHSKKNLYNSYTNQLLV